MLASIPSPSNSSLELGPLTFRAYGLMIALGVLAAVWLVGRRFEDRGYSADHATGLAMWAVPAGLVGARLYHVATDWQRFQGQWFDALKIWEGGLGILGGVIGGFVGGWFYARKHDIEMPLILDVVAPALPLAQAIGRWGNWFNQELFGRPTTVPWALEIDAEHRPAEYADSETFHPTFLYESLWNLALVAVLLRIERTKRLKPMGLFFAYLAGYSTGRLWIEAMRIDTASKVLGLRVNLWVFAVVLILSLVMVARSWRSAEEVNALVDSDEAVERAGGRHGASADDTEDAESAADSGNEDSRGTDDDGAAHEDKGFGDDSSSGVRPSAGR